MIRKAHINDLDALLELESLFPGDTLSRRSFKHFLSKGHADIFVFEETGKVIADAVILYRKGFKSARLYSLVVHPDARGKGVASQLMQNCETAVKEKNCVSLRLELREDNLPALRLYEKHGFKRIDYVSDYYEDHTSALRMRKDLTELKTHLLKVPYYAQTLEFSCGPACLIMAMKALGFKERRSRALELSLWREATTIFMMSGHGGCSAHGLAVAALRRGFRVGLYANDTSVPFLDSVRDPEKKKVIRLSHASFMLELKATNADLIIKDFSVTDVEFALEHAGIPLVLLSGYRLYGEKIPHWVVISGQDEDHFYIHDPFIPKELKKADSVNLPLAKQDFLALSRYGKAQQRYMLVLYRA